MHAGVFWKMLRLILAAALTITCAASIETARPVRLQLKVRNLKGKTIADLTPQDFQVSEGGVQRNVEQWSKVVDWFGRTSYCLEYIRPPQEDAMAANQAVAVRQIEVKVLSSDAIVSYRLKQVK
jgi:hypothetical protein